MRIEYVTSDNIPVFNCATVQVSLLHIIVVAQPCQRIGCAKCYYRVCRSQGSNRSNKKVVYESIGPMKSYTITGSVYYGQTGEVKLMIDNSSRRPGYYSLVLCTNRCLSNLTRDP
jgi:NifB/MoaA-like Fe-S oxidoreductase